LEEKWTKIEQQAKEIEQGKRVFRTLQTQQENKANNVISEHKIRLHTKLKEQRDELDLYLATEYGKNSDAIKDEKKLQEEYTKWHKSYKPFHWWSEFYEIMQKGGFDVIIGNPPYVEYREKIKKEYKILGYASLSCGNLHAYVTERALELALREGRIGLIVPLPTINTSRMGALQALIKPPLAGEGRSLHISAFDERPGNLFVGVDQRLAIEIFSSFVDQPYLATTGINRWASIARNNLFPTVCYTVQSSQTRQLTQSILNIKNINLEARMLSLFYTNCAFASYKSATKTSHILAYRTAGGRYWKVVLNRPFESESLSNKIAYLRDLTGEQAVALISSSTFWWYYSCHFDMYNLKDYMIFGFRFSNASQETLSSLQNLGTELVDSLEAHSTIETITSKTRGEVTSRRYVAHKSRPIIDEIDCILAQHYGFTDEELDFIINYDIKYRMGRDTGLFGAGGSFVL